METKRWASIPVVAYRAAPGHAIFLSAFLQMVCMCLSTCVMFPLRVVSRCAHRGLSEDPQTLVEFGERFGTEEACRAYLARLRWPEGFRCPACGHSRGWPNRRHDIECVRCGPQTSLTAGTILEGTRKPLQLLAKE